MFATNGSPKSVIRAWFLLSLFLLLGGCALRSGSTRDATERGAPGQSVLQWKGSADLAGYNIYRRMENTVPTRVNEEPVRPLRPPRRDEAVVDYEYVDRSVIVGEEYYYTFEEIAADGTRTQVRIPMQKVASALPANG